jgi:hypothetical protein
MKELIRDLMFIFIGAAIGWFLFDIIQFIKLIITY